MQRFTWKRSLAAVVATGALVGSAAFSSACAEQAAHRHHAPFGASTIGRGIAGQHDHFRSGADSTHHHYVHSPYGASTMGRGIAGFHSRHGL